MYIEENDNSKCTKYISRKIRDNNKIRLKPYLVI